MVMLSNTTNLSAIRLEYPQWLQYNTALKYETFFIKPW